MLTWGWATRINLCFLITVVIGSKQTSSPVVSRRTSSVRWPQKTSMWPNNWSCAHRGKQLNCYFLCSQMPSAASNRTWQLSTESVIIRESSFQNEALAISLANTDGICAIQAATRPRALLRSLLESVSTGPEAMKTLVSSKPLYKQDIP